MLKFRLLELKSLAVGRWRLRRPVGLLYLVGVFGKQAPWTRNNTGLSGN